MAGFVIILWKFTIQLFVLAPQANILVLRDSKWWISFRKRYFNKGFCDVKIDYFGNVVFSEVITITFSHIIFYMSSCRSTWIHVELLKTVHVEFYMTHVENNKYVVYAYLGITLALSLTTGIRDIRLIKQNEQNISKQTIVFNSLNRF